MGRASCRPTGFTLHAEIDGSATNVDETILCNTLADNRQALLQTCHTYVLSVLAANGLLSAVSTASNAYHRDRRAVEG